MDRADALALDARREVRNLSDPDLDAFHDRMWRYTIDNEDMKPHTDTEAAIAEWTTARFAAAKAEKARRQNLRERGGPPIGRGSDRAKRIKASVDLLETVVRAIGPPDQIKGSTYWWRCPFHQERTPSFKVDPERGQWWCFGACGRGGDVIDFVMEETGDFGRALDVLSPPEPAKGGRIWERYSE